MFLLRYEIRKDEVLRYLGYKGQSIDASLDELIESCRNEVRNLSDTKYLYEYFNIEHINEGVKVDNSDIIFKGNDIKKHLENCRSIAIIAVTAGVNIEKHIKLTEKTNLTKALIMDACTTTLVEEICDEIEEAIGIEAKSKELNITGRYSPGYGDLPLDAQRDVINLVNCDKRIGVNLSAHNILFPRKSVTAIIGVGKGLVKETEKEEKCLKCNKYASCTFRREVNTCGY